MVSLSSLSNPLMGSPSTHGHAPLPADRGAQD